MKGKVRRVEGREKEKERERELLFAMFLYDFPDSIFSALQDPTSSPLIKLELMCLYYSNNREP